MNLLIVKQIVDIIVLELMIMYNIRLRKLRKERNLYQKDVAEAIKTSVQVYNNYELGKREPDFDTFGKLADYFGVSTDYLLGKSNHPRSDESEQIAIRIPVFGHIPAGLPITAIENIIDYEEVPIEWGKGNKEYFALKIKGDSMSPKYLDDDVVIFLQTSDCDSGKDCAVMINGEDATFKKVIKQTNGIVLQPINTDVYDAVFYSNEDIEQLPIKVIGIAKEIRRTI